MRGKFHVTWETASFPCKKVRRMRKKPKERITCSLPSSSPLFPHCFPHTTKQAWNLYFFDFVFLYPTIFLSSTKPLNQTECKMR